jgi:hypothetical protein
VRFEKSSNEQNLETVIMSSCMINALYTFLAKSVKTLMRYMQMLTHKLSGSYTDLDENRMKILA